MSHQIAMVVRAFNEEAHIGRLLTGASRQTVVPDEVVVVDSGSTDSTVAIAEAFGARVVRVAPQSFSFGHALNAGLATLRGSDIAVLASAHVYPVYDTWIERLVAPFAEVSTALTYGRQHPPSHGRFSEQRLLAQWFPPKSVQRQQHPFCNNANAAIRLAIWRDLPYDPALTGLEDLDWAKRATAHGFHLSYVAEAPVVHVHDESFSQTMNRYRREAIAHKHIYHEQNMTAITAVRLALMNITGDIRAGVQADLPWRRFIDIPRFRTAQFLGTYKGFAQTGPLTEVLRRRFYYPASAGSRSVPPPEPSFGQPIHYD